MNSQKWGMGSETRRERGAYSPREKGRARSGVGRRKINEMMDHTEPGRAAPSEVEGENRTNGGIPIHGYRPSTYLSAPRWE